MYVVFVILIRSDRQAVVEAGDLETVREQMHPAQ